MIKEILKPTLGQHEESFSGTKDREKLKVYREQVFHQLVQSQLIKSYDTIVDDFNLPAITKDHISEYMKDLSPTELERVLSWPYELKLKIFNFYKKNIEDDPATVSDLLNKILEAAKKQYSMIGYHASSGDVRPEKLIDSTGKSVETWIIKGTEKDHRNDDLPMAYHSRDYEHLYLEKNPKYIYVVRIFPQKAKGDAAGAWGRDTSLSIIERLDMPTIREQVEEISQRLLAEDKDKKQPSESIRAAA